MSLRTSDSEDPRRFHELRPWWKFAYDCESWEADTLESELERFEEWARARLEMLVLGAQWVLDPPPRVETGDYALVVKAGAYRPVHRSLVSEALAAGARLVLGPVRRPSIREHLEAGFARGT